MDNKQVHVSGQQKGPVPSWHITLRAIIILIYVLLALLIIAKGTSFDQSVLVAIGLIFYGGLIVSVIFVPVILGLCARQCRAAWVAIVFDALVMMICVAVLLKTLSVPPLPPLRGIIGAVEWVAIIIIILWLDIRGLLRWMRS